MRHSPEGGFGKTPEEPKLNPSEKEIETKGKKSLKERIEEAKNQFPDIYKKILESSKGGWDDTRINTEPIDFRIVDNNKAVYILKSEASDRNDLEQSIKLGVYINGDVINLFDEKVYSYNADDVGSYEKYNNFYPDKKYDRIEGIKVQGDKLIIKVHAPLNIYVKSKERIDIYEESFLELQEKIKAQKDAEKEKKRFDEEEEILRQKQFDPRYPEYKQVSDLPKSMKDDFKDVAEGGFVEKSADDKEKVESNFRKLVGIAKDEIETLKQLKDKINSFDTKEDLKVFLKERRDYVDYHAGSIYSGESDSTFAKTARMFGLGGYGFRHNDHTEINKVIDLIKFNKELDSLVQEEKQIRDELRVLIGFPKNIE